ncbi:23S rRNA (adenine(2503)-C(2))-methyltransferase RlmN [Patescibacteria group bacterium]|nr:23S rRNA (adenine(2503)-C(2))-methyltransferase RlmN [Patescibacteria group bacterium]
MNLEKFNEILGREPPYRLKQIKRSLFIELIDNWQQATTLSKELREKLTQNLPLSIKAESFVSNDKKTIKALITLEDGQKVETVLLKHKDKRNTVCLSSQVGCALACEFCATGKFGFKRNLTSSEIVTQLLFFARLLNKEGERVSNVVFMGMGEPFLNYDNVLEAVRTLNDEDGLKIGARKISISTAGIIEGIEKLVKEKLQINLAISLHSAKNNVRSKLMPINLKYPLQKIIEAVKDYTNKTRRRVMFEYVMIEGINDRADDAIALAEIMKDEFYLVNLISYNATGVFKPSSGMKIKRFKEILQKQGIEVTQRYRFGDNIEAACGQLAGKHSAKEVEL